MSTPTKFNDPEVKKQMTATKYRKEQEQTAIEAIINCPTRNIAVELYAGTGGLTREYKKSFKIIYTNDLNKNADTNYHMKAIDFIRNHLVVLSDKIDLIDFDCYGCPAMEIQEYFKVRGNQDAPFTLRFSDGLGLYLKRNKNEKTVRDRYLIEGPLDMTKIWLRHPDLIDYFLKKIAGMYGMEAIKLISVQTKFKNYVLGAYHFKKI